ncbi:MAG: hypothetical protein ACI35P_14080 [Bacillus sp. (in: firmicutes)]
MHHVLQLFAGVLVQQSPVWRHDSDLKHG